MTSHVPQGSPDASSEWELCNDKAQETFKILSLPKDTYFRSQQYLLDETSLSKGKLLRSTTHWEQLKSQSPLQAIVVFQGYCYCPFPLR